MDLESLRLRSMLRQLPEAIDVPSLTAERKMVLLVDLDNTIIHHRNKNMMKETALRPGLHAALAEWKKRFNLIVCTAAGFCYAISILELVDPAQKYFEPHLFCRRDFSKLKTEVLSHLCPDGNIAPVVMIDDREDVWTGTHNNILVEEYKFFKRGDEILGITEDTDNYLQTLTGILNNIHHEYYKRIDANSSSANAQAVISSLREKVLTNTTIDFGAFPESQGQEARQRAARLGANIAKVDDRSITHFVVFTQRSLKGKERKRWKKIKQMCPHAQKVTSDWLKSCYTHFMKIDPTRQQNSAVNPNTNITHSYPSRASFDVISVSKSSPMHLRFVIRPSLTLSPAFLPNRDANTSDTLSPPANSDVNMVDTRSPPSQSTSDVRNVNTSSSLPLVTRIPQPSSDMVDEKPPQLLPNCDANTSDTLSPPANSDVRNVNTSSSPPLVIRIPQRSSDVNMVDEKPPQPLPNGDAKTFDTLPPQSQANSDVNTVSASSLPILVIRLSPQPQVIIKPHQLLPQTSPAQTVTKSAELK